MEYQKTGNQLRVRLIRDFNLFTVRRMAPLAADVDAVHIDLSGAKIVDSEAVRLLYQLVRSGKRVTLAHPPEIMREVIDVLGLEEVLDIDAMTTGEVETQ
jgi:ABC-type transporter Mla MlaB component